MQMDTDIVDEIFLTWHGDILSDLTILFSHRCQKVKS